MIVELRAENFQRLKAVQIRPHGRVVRLTGDNGEGKTSVLEAIASAIRGKDACPRDPIRGGADKAWVSLDLGDKIVRRPAGFFVYTVHSETGCNESDFSSCRGFPCRLNCQ